MKQGSLRSSAYAVLTAFIWGTAFVAQSVGAEHVPPLAFNAARSVIAFVFLLVLCAVMRSGRRRKGQVASITRSRKDLLLGGFWCGLTLGLASFLQQKGLDTTSPGKAGFITALYIVLVPIFGIFLKKRVPKAVWVSVLLAVTGLYCLCITESFTVAPGDVNAYAASLMFSMDRYASYKQDWGAFYEAGGLVIADRYTTSNAVHQASKLPPEERTVFLNWLFELEYGKLGLPKPDLVLYLDMPTEITEKMMRSREAATGTHADIHEQDEAYLKSCREAAREIVKDCGWTVIHCAKGDAPRTVEDIHNEVYKTVKSLL